MTEKSTSPIPGEIVGKKSNQMSFPDAMQAVQEGEKITRLEWGDEKVYGIKKDGFLMLHKDDDKFYNWIVNDGDMDALDWITL
jgi:hypothetical protein